MAGFNKMFIMLPLMFATRKLNGEDPQIIFLLRCAYGTVQTIILLVTIFVYMKAKKLATKNTGKRVIYVPPPPQPFADPNDTKKRYKQVVYGEHLVTTARGLIGSTFFGICMTVGLHMWKGMVVGLAMQSVMGPFNLFENALAKAILLGQTEGRIFDEKKQHELGTEDEVVDKDGNVVTIRKKVDLEELLLDTWDDGVNADTSALMAALNKKNINSKTKKNGWTPIMIIAAIKVPETAANMKLMKERGADPAITDSEGWNALHWAAYHGSTEGALYLVSKDGYAVTTDKGGNLHKAKDNDGKDPLEHAKAGGFDGVSDAIKRSLHGEDDVVVAEVANKEIYEDKKTK